MNQQADTIFFMDFHLDGVTYSYINRSSMGSHVIIQSMVGMHGSDGVLTFGNYGTMARKASVDPPQLNAAQKYALDMFGQADTQVSAERMLEAFWHMHRPARHQYLNGSQDVIALYKTDYVSGHQILEDFLGKSSAYGQAGVEVQTRGSCVDLYCGADLMHMNLQGRLDPSQLVKLEHYLYPHHGSERWDKGARYGLNPAIK